jgi:hypothetical protein
MERAHPQEQSETLQNIALKNMSKLAKIHSTWNQQINIETVTISHYLASS